MIELEDIQHYLLTRPNAKIAQYDFLTFKDSQSARKWLTELLPTIGTVKSVMDSSEADMRWVTVAFTFNGLRAIGVDEESLSTFPEPFRQGMAARAAILGDTGENHPDNWQDKMASPDLHGTIILFAKDKAERTRCENKHLEYLKRNPGVEVMSTLLLEAIPPFDYVHEHFGYRDRLTTPVIEGMGAAPTPGSHPVSKPGEFILGYPDETGNVTSLPRPEILTKNGSYLAYRKMQEHVGRFRDYLKASGKTVEEQELVAAKLMGRWRKSGAPLVLCPDKDNEEIGWDDNRNNDFEYAKMDPYGYACPVGSHIRRMNVRDNRISNIMDRRLIIRRGGTYGPHLPDDASEDGKERGIAVFAGCADIARQFEFLISVWSNDREFMELDERDPFCGTQDGTLDFTIPKRPIKKKQKGIPAFTNVKGGAYFFLPGIKGLNYLAALK
jgi:deferrochelatase/peroxidase EfeB